MNLRLNAVLALAIAGVVAGCGGEEKTTNPDGGSPADTGVVTQTDSGVADSGTEVDGGVRPDGGSRPDSGMPMGTCPANTLGCECQPGGEADPQGSCMSADHICVTFSDDPATSICVRPCELANGDNDCAGETVAGRMNRPANLCRGGLFDGFGTCTERDAQDGEQCVYGALAGERMAACPAGSVCFIGFGADEPYLGSCGRTCAGDADCGGDKPTCLGGVLNSTVADGICTDRIRGPGAVCDPTDITSLCTQGDIIDFGGGNRFGSIQCIGLLSEQVGHCFEICDTRAPAETTCGDVRAASAGLSPSCTANVFNIPNVGVCENECSNFPENCPSPNQNCSAVQIQQQNLDLSWCLDIIEPALAEFNGTAGDNCASDPDQFSCPKGTLCIGDGQGGGVCARGCDALAGTSTASPSTCAASPIPDATCQADQGMREGICFP